MLTKEFTIRLDVFSDENGELKFHSEILELAKRHRESVGSLKSKFDEVMKNWLKQMEAIE